MDRQRHKPLTLAPLLIQEPEELNLKHFIIRVVEVVIEDAAVKVVIKLEDSS